MKLSESIEGSLLQGKAEEMRKRRQTLQKTMMVILSMIVLSVSGCSEKEENIPLTKVETEGELEETQEEERESAEEPHLKSEEIYIYVCGEVRNPGVYKLEAGSRINHAIFAAGGMTDGAADTYLNQAELVEDGQKIYVPSKDEVAEQNLALEGSGNNEPSDDRININIADKTQLTTLSGIGDSRAEAIITYRETVGAFKTIEEIQKIDGIKEGIFLKIKDKIKVE